MSTLYVIATPIGNLADITLRALEVLGTLPALACEDTRRTRKIFERHALTPPASIFSYHEHNEEKAGRRILEHLDRGEDVGLCSDGGMPGVSDPGYRIVSAVLDTDHSVTVLPGPCAAETALVASGLPSSSFLFKGFPPRKGGKLRTWLEEDAAGPHTLIAYESPYRIGKFLAAAHEVLGDRQAAVCIELTKLHERVARGWLSDLAQEFANTSVKGEVTVVVAGSHPKFCRDASS